MKKAGTQNVASENAGLILLCNALQNAKFVGVFV